MITTRVVGFLALVALSSGCRTAVLTAESSLNPVLIGPQRRLAAPAGAPKHATEPLTQSSELAIEVADAAAASRPGGGLSVSSSRSAQTVVDAVVMLTTAGDPERRVWVTSVWCKGYLLFGILAAASASVCRIEADVQTLGPTRVHYTAELEKP